MNYSLHTFTADELIYRMEKAPIDKKTMNIPVFDGFYYFAPVDFNDAPHNNGTRFITAICHHTKQVIGVMKTKRYSQDNHQFVPEDEKDTIPNYVAILYVDIHRSWQRKGVAKALYQELNDQMKKPDVVLGTPLSKDGRLAKLNEVRQRLITNVNSFDSFDEMNSKTLNSQYYE